MKTGKFIFLLMLLNGYFVARAQQEPEIHVAADKNKMLIGEPLQLTVSVSYPERKKIQFNFPDSIPHFELLEKPVLDSAYSNGLISLKKIYRLTSFDSGHWLIPSYRLTAAVQSDTIPVDVVFSDFDPMQDYHDIKDILEVKTKSRQQWWWYVAAVALLAAGLAFYFLRKRKTPIAETKTGIDAYEEAMKQLSLLSGETKEVKQFHSRLSSIFRTYVHKRKGIHSLQKTTDDLVWQLREQGMEAEAFERMAQALRLSDFVKFAKYIPSAEDNQRCFNNILQSIKFLEHTTLKTGNQEKE